MTEPSAAPTAPVAAESEAPEAILVGVDDESPSRHALEWALRRAERRDASVTAAWVVGNGENDDDARRALAERIETARAAAGIGPEAVPVAEEVLHGDVVGALLGRAGRADLLVIGTNFTPSLVGRLRGTRSLKLAADAPVPVVVVPEVELVDARASSSGSTGARPTIPLSRGRRTRRRRAATSSCSCARRSCRSGACRPTSIRARCAAPSSTMRGRPSTRWRRRYARCIRIS